MPASQGECVVGAVLLTEETESTVEGCRGWNVADCVPVESRASSCASFLCKSLKPARTAASSELTGLGCAGVELCVPPETRRAIRSAISLA